MKNSSKFLINRRKFIAATAGGIAVSSIGGLSPALAGGYDKAFRWISPRGTLEVVDDYAFWVGKSMGYFGDLNIEMQPGPSDGTATVKFVDVGQADMGFPSPGVFSFALENGMELKSVFHEAAKDGFSLAFRKGEGVSNIKDIEGKTILLGSAAWQPIVDPMLAAVGVDVSKVKYVEAGWPTWGTALAAGQGDAALSWEGLRAEWVSTGLDFEYWLGIQHSNFPMNTFVVRASDLEDSDKKSFLEKYLRGWAMGLEFADHNPRAAVQAVYEQFPTLAQNVGPNQGTMSCLHLHSVLRGNYAKGKGWGWHDMDSWQNFFDVSASIGQNKVPVNANDVCTNELIAGANDFDKTKVKADAEATNLNSEFEAVDIEGIKSSLYDQSI